MNKILFHKDEYNEVISEFNFCRKYFGDCCIENKSQVKPGDVVLGRYSVLPHYFMHAIDAQYNGATFYVSIFDHEFISSMQWAHPDCLKNICDLTPKTWWNGRIPLDDLPDSSFVVKGETKGKKSQWNTHMFANTKQDVPFVIENLRSDYYIGQQSLVIREFEQFEILEKNKDSEINFSNEWRIFVFNGKILDFGYYWHIAECANDVNEDKENFRKEFEEIIKVVVERTKLETFVVDVARRIDGIWRVVELNEFQMSGLATINPDYFYQKLFENFQ